MGRMIDAEKLKADFIFFGNRYYTAQAIEFVIDQQPTVDAEPVIRCKDCKYWEYDVIFSDGWCRGKHQGNPNWFCANGERKENGQID